MTVETQSRDRHHDNDLGRTAVWMILLPVIVAWPILSTVALLSLFVEGRSLVFYTVQFTLFITGFWTALSGFLFAKFVKRSEVLVQDAQTAAVKDRGTVVGAYVVIWTFFYVIAAFASA